MRLRILISTVLLALALGATILAAAGTNGKGNDKDAPAVAVPASHSAQDDPMRLEGERRYHANCGRCHMAPPKFAPRMMTTIVRHMRVRATLTDEDMRAILQYMTQ